MSNTPVPNRSFSSASGFVVRRRLSSTPSDSSSIRYVRLSMSRCSHSSTNCCTGPSSPPSSAGSTDLGKYRCSDSKLEPCDMIWVWEATKRQVEVEQVAAGRVAEVDDGGLPADHHLIVVPQQQVPDHGEHLQDVREVARVPIERVASDEDDLRIVGIDRFRQRHGHPEDAANGTHTTTMNDDLFPNFIIILRNESTR
uniref:Uncharacterized protein n=1 Tax=Anopheles farauti TaxID=69004 RepID=A0A182QLJ8_9DIPT